MLADIYLLLEAYAADVALAKLLSGLNNGINTLHTLSAAKRPTLNEFSKPRQAPENFLRVLLSSKSGKIPKHIPLTDSLIKFKERVAAMEGGIAALDWHPLAAITYAIQYITQAGDNIVSTTQRYGATCNFFQTVL